MRVEHVLAKFDPHALTFDAGNYHFRILHKKIYLENNFQLSECKIAHFKKN